MSAVVSAKGIRPCILRKHLIQRKYYCRYPWSVGDIGLWGNVATLHYRPAFDPNQRRISLVGGRPF